MKQMQLIRKEKWIILNDTSNEAIGYGVRLLMDFVMQHSKQYGECIEFFDFRLKWLSQDFPSPTRELRIKWASLPGSEASP